MNSLQRKPIPPSEHVPLLPETQNINQENQINNEELLINDLLSLGPALPLLAITHIGE